MSFWKSLFGGGKENGAGKPVRTLEHNGFLIEARPYAEAGQYQVAGTISKVVGGERKEHRFVRADRFGSIDDAAEVALMKGRQMVEQQGDRVFGP
jgi:hypothetical protein